MYGKLLQVRFQSHKDYILPYIPIKFHVVVAKSASYAAVFFSSQGCRSDENCSRITAAKVDLLSLIEKKQYEWTDNGH